MLCNVKRNQIGSSVAENFVEEETRLFKRLLMLFPCSVCNVCTEILSMSVPYLSRCDSNID